MKKSVVLVAVLFAVVLLAGCKKKQDSSMEALNGVASENVVSVADANVDSSGVPVVVENAETAPMDAAGEMAVPASADKPSTKQIQQALKNAGFYTGKIDGDIGPRTKRSIEAFQAQNGLKADGKVGAKTWKLLSAHLNSAPEVANPSAVEQAPVQR